MHCFFDELRRVRVIRFCITMFSMMVIYSIGLIGASLGDVRLPAVFGDHMVLQRDQELRFWGWAQGGEKVVVEFGGKSAQGVADDQGRWVVKFPAMAASKLPQVLTIRGANTFRFEDVLVGEVWLCSGQSNMEWTVAASGNPQEEIATGDHPLIRHIKVPLVASMVPLEDFKGQWQVCSPQTVAGFTACGYYMARELSKKLDVPVGLVNASWGGTRIEPWVPPVGFEQVEALSGIYRSVMGRTPGSKEYQQKLGDYIGRLESWLQRAKQEVGGKGLVEPSPGYPGDLAPFTSNQDPTMLYNGMIHSVVGFPIRGAIWYQGESNHDEGMLYLEKKKGLVQGWRTLWNQGEFPFYYVQIAPFRYGDADPTTLAKFWEAQGAIEKAIPSTGMVVINDVATVNDIHPPNKQEVGRRLALLALRDTYGKTDVVARGPQMEGFEVSGGELKVTFKNTAGGLKTRDGKEPSHFEVIGVGSNGYHAAKASIHGDQVILTCEAVKAPRAFRFAWNMLAEPNLCGGTGLPVGAFRAGVEPDFLDSISTAKEYKLIYDLDLNKLSADIQYDVKVDAANGSFDRIGYLVELTDSNGAERKVFVTMKAFTDDVKKIGIPTLSSGARFQMPVEDMDVFSSTSNVASGRGISSGSIEFWPDNYGMVNGAHVEGASDSIYDFGDEIALPPDGYGSMQVHNVGAKQTIFAINQWKAAQRADIGIGNSDGNTKDWTFTNSASSWMNKRLRVYVRPKP